jgi:phosphoglycolate phosphatase
VKTIIFDFDGTIADSLEIVIDIYRQLTKDKRELTLEEREALRKLPAQKVMKALGIPMWRAPFLVSRGRKIMHNRLDEVEVFPDLPKVLKTLKERGYELRIVTSNSADNVHVFLKKHGLVDYFNEVTGSIGLFSKAKVLRRMVKAEKLDLMHTFYVGDEARDIVASKKAGVPVISVAWGYNHENLLKKLHPYKLAKKPEDLLEIFS